VILLFVIIVGILTILKGENSEVELPIVAVEVIRSFACTPGGILTTK
jgi:hypothetical protein